MSSAENLLHSGISNSCVEMFHSSPMFGLLKKFRHPNSYSVTPSLSPSADSLLSCKMCFQGFSSYKARYL